MSNGEKEGLIDRTPLPRSRAGLARDLAALGVTPGMSLIVHASLARLGFVVGGAPAVIHALMDVLGPDGTLVMPTFTGGLTDPATWRDPPVPQEWHAVIRDTMLPFDAARTPTRLMGQIAEQFRTWPDVKRSNHPVTSLAAWGRHAEYLVERHSLAWSLGDETPMGRLYERDGWILLLGVGHDRNSSLHLAETRAVHGRRKLRRMPVERDGRVAWEEFPEVDDDRGRLFPLIGADYEKTGAARIGFVGSAESRLMRQRDLVDFAAAWLDRKLAP
ncbi:MAG TPA: AAC(3) family N-acetyltransferase [Stellaceae bacterium]|jgi:aminoglycoside 3-N-acetyltransferase|nr:AAC(3) family N-acetyltransferase [Stellaceae bacterium]